MLLSGGADSDILLWDLVSYSAVCRLHGHKDAVTGLSFISSAPVGSSFNDASSLVNFVVSVSKDTLMKVSICQYGRCHMYVYDLIHFLPLIF
jgi:U3 small nucleolar RNA-associated protein 12